MDENQIDLNILRQIADDTCTISFEAYIRMRSKGYVESEIENTPDGVYARLSERGAKLLRQAKAPDEVVMLSHNLEHVATQWVQLHQAISDALGLPFEPNEDIERYTEAIGALRQQLKAIELICNPILERGWRTPISELSSFRLAGRIHEVMVTTTQEAQ